VLRSGYGETFMEYITVTKKVVGVCVFRALHFGH
jgi:hypothetical protein